MSRGEDLFAIFSYEETRVKFKFWKAITLSTVVCVMAAASAGALAAGEKFTIRLGASQPADHPMTETMNKFKELVEKNSSGRIKVEVYPANQLGSQVQMNEGVKSGSVTMTYSSIAYIGGNYEPKYNSLMLPFLIRKDNVDKAWKALDGDLGKELAQTLEKVGIKPMGYGPIGLRNITNSKREIRTPADLKGIKIRLQPNAVHIDTFKTLGANPVALDFSELYSALQQGVVDAQENPIDIIATNRFNEVQKYLTLTGHFYDFAGLWMNKAFYDKLPADLQKVVSDASQRAVEFHRKLYNDKEAGYLDQLKKNGMQVYQPTAEQLNKFQATAEPVYGKFLAESKDKAFTLKVWKIMGR